MQFKSVSSETHYLDTCEALHMGLEIMLYLRGNLLNTLSNIYICNPENYRTLFSFENLMDLNEMYEVTLNLHTHA